MSVRKDMACGTMLRVTGPATVVVEKGRVLLLGVTYGSGSRLLIKRMRTYCLKALEDTTVSVILGTDAKVEEAKPEEEVLDEWLEAVERALTSNARPLIIMVVGPVDCGKTTLTAIAANMALQRGFRTAVVDADIGQADIGCPGFVSAAFIKQPILYLSELYPEFMRFVGVISPMPSPDLVITAVMDIIADVIRHGAEAVVIDTDGWFNSLEAVLVKARLIKAVKPTHVLVVIPEDLGWLYTALYRKVGRFNIAITRLGVPKVRRTRGRSERRQLRELAYTKILAGSRRRRVKIGEVAMLNTSMFSGDPMPPDKLSSLANLLGAKPLYGEVVGERAMVVVEDYREVSADNAKLSEITSCERTKLIKASSERGLLSAIIGDDLREVAPAIISRILWDRGEIELITPWEGEVRGIMVGRVKLKFEEGFVREECKVRGSPI